MSQALSMMSSRTDSPPLEEDEAAILADLVAARCATAIVVSAWR